MAQDSVLKSDAVPTIFTEPNPTVKVKRSKDMVSERYVVFKIIKGVWFYQQIDVTSLLFVFVLQTKDDECEGKEKSMHLFL